MKMYAMEGRFTFTSHNAGEHVICIHSNSTAWFSAAQLVSLTLSFIRQLVYIACLFITENCGNSQSSLC